MNEARLIDIEIKVSYQEDTIEMLNDIVTKQQQQLNKLQKSLEVLADRMQDVKVQFDDPLNPADERPPHY